MGTEDQCFIVIIMLGEECDQVGCLTPSNGGWMLWSVIICSDYGYHPLGPHLVNHYRAPDTQRGTIR